MQKVQTFRMTKLLTCLIVIRKLECNDHFYIRDKFQDPLDGREFFHHPFELPGGTPYAINYDFFRISRKVENFSICSICSKKFGLLYV